MATFRRSAWVPFTAILTSAALHAPLATAAETPRDMQVLQEIIVTATKRSERLQDVPIAVSAITGEDIQARGFTNYGDYLNTIPGVYFQDGGPGHGIIRIRGSSASEGGVHVRLAFQRGPLAVELFGDNIFDERAIVNTGQPSFGSRENIERPRELGVELRYSFD